jgi:hypothetical protein
MLFQNYGLFWRADRINWGSRGKGNEGRLLGRTSPTSPPVDFRNQRGVYALYDDAFQMLYVGQAGYGNKKLYDRLHNHMSDHLAERWQRFSWFGIDPVDETEQKYVLVESEPQAPQVNQVLDHLEAILIAAAEPKLNRQGGKFGDAKKYHQKFVEQAEGEDINANLKIIELPIAPVAAPVKLK